MLFGIKPKAASTTPVDPAPRLPRLLARVWGIFQEIGAGIEGNGWSYPIITWEAIEAWSVSTGQSLDGREARAIIHLGQRRAAILNKALAKKNAGKN